MPVAPPLPTAGVVVDVVSDTAGMALVVTGLVAAGLRAIAILNEFSQERIEWLTSAGIRHRNRPIHSAACSRFDPQLRCRHGQSADNTFRADVPSCGSAGRWSQLARPGAAVGDDRPAGVSVHGGSRHRRVLRGPRRRNSFSTASRTAQALGAGPLALARGAIAVAFFERLLAGFFDRSLLGEAGDLGGLAGHQDAEVERQAEQE